MKIRVFGSKVDMTIAQNILGTRGYEYVGTGGMTAGDIIVGGTGALGGVPSQVEGVKRLAGMDRAGTEWEVLKYGLGKGIMPNVSELMDQSIIELARIGYLTKALKSCL